ncbi:MAG: hypothetical protein AAGU06_03710 [Candidatus Shapirobacteria bacterium]
MYFLDKEYAGKVARILVSSYYKKWVSYFEGVLKVTRSKDVRNNKDVLLAIQLKLAKIETQLWDLLNEGRGKAKILKSKDKLSIKEQKSLEGLEEQIFIHEQLIRISRTICDGIAWRNLNYNRMFLTSSARSFGTGRVDVNSKEFKSEFNWAYRISKELNSIVLINDLTHFLKVGDLTEIKDNVTFIHEIKKYGKDIKNIFTLKKVRGNAKISNQAKRLLELQRIALNGGVKIGDENVEAKEINLKLKTYNNKVKELIKKSESELIVSEDIDDCINIEVINFKAINQNKVKFEELKKISNKNKLGDKKDLILIHSNWDTFYSDEQGNFLRSMPPYSVYPFSSKDCINLMSGFYLVKTTLNVSKLEQILKNKGWDIEDRTESDLDKQIADFEENKGIMFTVKDPLYAHNPQDDGIFTIRKGPFSLPLSAMIYCRITMEYLSIESLLDIVGEMYKIAAKKKSSDMYFPVFKDEEKMWN